MRGALVSLRVTLIAYGVLLLLDFFRFVADVNTAPLIGGGR